jgi:hypothetical protein
LVLDIEANNISIMILSYYSQRNTHYICILHFHLSTGADLDRVSALFFLAYANSAGGVMKLLMATENGAQELRVKVREKGYYTMFSRLLDFHFWVNSQGGTQQISEILADRIGRKNIHLEQPVASISQSDESDLVTVKTLSAKIFR